MRLCARAHVCACMRMCAHVCGRAHVDECVCMYPRAHVCGRAQVCACNNNNINNFDL